MKIGTRRIAMMFVACLISEAHAIDMNQADRAEIERMPQVGVASAERILKERERGGPFRSWADFQQRVPGFKERRIEALRRFGVTIETKPTSIDVQTPDAQEGER